ncbi:fumarylacetoacetate hydrolase family protein [Wenxinia saemankumensis]|uniref:Fumarylacetoacetate (FAA) hydrolase n=1 Tax=Wenxinia saemankumensis TaxID=1447782 RepID=A0A1M6ACA2_9RHOB|nr:fumarylacetoacetate hydrolase family protein [Wenxinia saemankumensis]SHI34164.1 fumarylacetoacetate (FAA) hydrolase [Wenxinia saemankumensis]
MRVATLRDGSPDGRLVLVAEDGATCRPAAARTLQAALDDGSGAGFEAAGEARPFDPAAAMAPLPRAFLFLDGSAYVNHVDLVRRARGAEMPARFWHDPLMYQGHSVFDGPRAPIRGAPEWGIDFEAEVAVMTRAVPRGTSPGEARALVAFVTLLNDVSLRALIPEELSKGFGFVQSKPASSCAPLAVAPDDLPGWDGGRLHGALRVDLNGRPFGRAEAGEDMTFDFPRLIAHAARTRDLSAGTVIGSGTVSNRDAGGGPGRPVAEGGRGYSCLAEQRMVETLQTGAPVTPFLAGGDRVTIRMEDGSGRDLFGTIEQVVDTAPA